MSTIICTTTAGCKCIDAYGGEIRKLADQLAPIAGRCSLERDREIIIKAVNVLRGDFS